MNDGGQGLLGQWFVLSLSPAGYPPSSVVFGTVAYDFAITATGLHDVRVQVKSSHAIPDLSLRYVRPTVTYRLDVAPYTVATWTGDVYLPDLVTPGPGYWLDSVPAYTVPAGWTATGVTFEALSP